MRNARRMAKRIVAEATLALPPGATILEDKGQWTNRFEVRSETSDRVYIVSQHREKGHWGCSCPAWRTRRKCKHLRAMGLPEFEVPHQVTIARRIAEESEGARREREIHELDQQFYSPAYDDERPAGGRARAEQAYTDALDSARSLMDGPALGAVLRIVWDNADDREVAGYCRAIAEECGNVGPKGWLKQLANKLDICADAGEELNSGS